MYTVFMKRCQFDKFSDRSLKEKKEYVTNRLERIAKLIDVSFGTMTAKEMFLSKLNFQKEFFDRLTVTVGTK